jgi:ElaB/YqjD/DUF883 family membrane-anchored ribosome-binding protein
MEQNQNRGGAAPSLAAHSKDASAPGQTPASSAMPSPQPSTAGNDMMGKAHDVANEAMRKVNDVTNDAMRTASDTASKMSDTATKFGSSAAEQASDYIQTQPLFALAATGLVCLVLGAMLGRR